MRTNNPHTSFRRRLAAGEQLCGTFIKTPTSHGTEICGEIGFDFTVIDEEHAPFDRSAIDQCILAARAAGIAALVRVSSRRPESLLSALDCGATGVFVPHVYNEAIARDVANACRYVGGKRGYSNSPRSGGYGALPLAEHLQFNDEITTVVAQIEDSEALDEIDAIAAVKGVDALFIGRGDLAVALGAAAPGHADVKRATQHICAAARRAGKPTLAFVSDKDDAREMAELGVTGFVWSSDQGLLRRAAMSALSEMRDLFKSL